jgi:hypothetical protein
MRLYVTAPFALEVLQLPAQFPEGVAHRNVGVCVGLVAARRVARLELTARYRRAQPHFVAIAFVLVTFQFFHDHVTGKDVGREAFKPLGVPSDVGTQSR